jgi:energy-converting hydrogenase Eha subunit G
MQLSPPSESPDLVTVGSEIVTLSEVLISRAFHPLVEEYFLPDWESDEVIVVAPL